MLAVTTLSGPVPAVGVVLLSVAAAGALVLRTARARAVAMALAGVGAPALLLADIWDSPQLRFVHDRPLAAAAGALVALGLLTAAARAVRSRPRVFPVLVVAALPFRVPIEAGGSTANLLVPLYLVVAIGALAFAAPALARPGRQAGTAFSRAARPGALEWALGAYLVLYALQATYSSDFARALQQVVFFYAPFALLYALVAHVAWTRSVVRAVLRALLGLALLFTLVGFLEFATKTIFLNPKLVVANDFHSYFRVNSVFFDPNIYGRFLVIAMVVAAVALVSSSARRDVGLAAGVLVVLWGGLVLTLSQSSLVGLLAGLAVLAALRWRTRYVAFAVGAAALVAVLLVVLLPHAVGIDVRSSRALNSDSSGRVDLIDGGVALFAARPLVGLGSASFAHEFRARRRASSPTAVSASHTIPITVAAEQGIAGVLAYLALLGAAFVRLLRGARRAPARIAVAAAFTALVVHTLVYAAFLEDPVSWALLGVGTALAAGGGARGEGVVRVVRSMPVAPDAAPVT